MATHAIWKSIAQTTGFTAKQLILGYSELVQRAMNQGFNAYLLTFMFKALPGSPKALQSQMNNEVQRVYSTFVTRVVRKPRSQAQNSFLPFLITIPDRPVFKQNKSNILDLKINNGLHLHGVLCVPCISRLRVDVATHFNANTAMYVKDRLLRIDIKHVYSADVVDYMFKSLKNGNADPDDIQIYR